MKKQNKVHSNLSTAFGCPWLATVITLCFRSSICISSKWWRIVLKFEELLEMDAVQRSCCRGWLVKGNSIGQAEAGSSRKLSGTRTNIILGSSEAWGEIHLDFYCRISILPFSNISISSLPNSHSTSHRFISPPHRQAQLLWTSINYISQMNMHVFMNNWPPKQFLLFAMKI